MTVRPKKIILCLQILTLTLGSAIICQASERIRYQSLSAIGDISIDGKGYIISENGNRPYLAPMPTESYADYCKRTSHINRSEFFFRQKAADGAFLLSPSGGMNTELLQIEYTTSNTIRCIRVKDLGGNNDIRKTVVLGKCNNHKMDQSSNLLASILKSK